MGKPSTFSRKNSHIRKKKWQLLLKKQIKCKDEEVADLQLQMHDIRKFVEGASESVTYELNKCSRENNNLVNWLKLYDKQIKDYEKEIYHLKLRSYFSAQH